MWKLSSSTAAAITYRNIKITSITTTIKAHLISLSFYTTTTTPTTNTESTQSRPPPIKVSLTESAGRGVFATRKIDSGELIHTAKPLISHPYSSLGNSITNVCYLCLKHVKKNDMLCDQDGASPIFCSDHCKHHSKGFYEVEKQADWTAHTEHCRTQGLKYPFLAKRLACMVVSGAVSAEALDILQPAILSREMILQMEEEFTLLRGALEGAAISDEKISFLTKQWYIGVLARIRINAFRIETVGRSYEDLLSLAAASVEAEAAVGNALYMLPSFYNHDCDPNAHILWIESVDARVKALRDIDEGEELRICYIDASMDYDARQTILSEGFGFKCGCLRCRSGDKKITTSLITRHH